MKGYRFAGQGVLVMTVTAVMISFFVLIGRPAGGDAAAIARGLDSVSAPARFYLNYQSRLLDPVTGEPKPDGIYGMTFRLYTAASGGTAVWQETKDVSVSRGTFSTLLGDTTPLSTSVFNGQALWLGVKVGSDAEATPRQPVTFVGYALYAENANRLDGQDASGFASASHAHSGADVTSGIIGESYIDDQIARDAEVSSAISNHAGDAATHHPRYTNSEAWNSVLNNDGPGSTLNADLLDGKHGSEFAASAHVHDGRYYTEAESNGRFLNAVGPDSMSGNSGSSILSVSQGGSGYVASFNGDSYGIYASTSATSGSTYGVVGVGNSQYGYGGYFSSNRGIGLKGVHTDASQVMPAIFGENTGAGPAILGDSHGSQAAIIGRSYGSGYAVEGLGGQYSGGVYGASGATSGYVRGVFGATSSTGGDGVYGDALASSGLAYGVHGQTASSDGRGVFGYASAASGGRTGVRGEVNGTGYGLYTTDYLYVGVGCIGCTVSYIALNRSQEALEVGDLVAVSGVEHSLQEAAAPTLQVRPATSADGAVLGVVSSRGEYIRTVDEEKGVSESVQPVAGAIETGDYLFVITSGLAQVRVAPATGEFLPGQQLVVSGVNGRAAPAAAEDPSMPVIGRAMEATPDENGLMWVLIATQ